VTKACKICGVTKPISEFYKHSMTADGLYPSCKKCHCERCKKNRDKDIRAYRKKHRERKRTEKGKAIDRKAYEKAIASGKRASNNKNWKLQNPEKYKAYLEIKKAIYHGKVKRQGCVLCGEKAQAHHEDYSKPLEVIWLCQKHHAEHHVEKRNAELK
jgi:hypothetical protein